MSESEHLSAFLVKKGGQLWHYCPACDDLHSVAIDEPYKNGSRWDFDGNVEKPSLSPSVKVTVCRTHDPDFENKICHYFLKNGRFEYLSDCTHKLAGMRIPMVEIPEKFIKYF